MLPAARHEERRVGRLRADERRQAHCCGVGLVPAMVRIAVVVSPAAGLPRLITIPVCVLCLHLLCLYYLLLLWRLRNHSAGLPRLFASCAS